MRITLTILSLFLLILFCGCRRTSHYPRNETRKVRMLVPDRARTVKPGDTQNRVINSRGFPDVKMSVFADSIPYHVWIYTTRTDQEPPEDYFMEWRPQSALNEMNGLVSTTGKRWRYSDFDLKAKHSYGPRYVLAWEYIFFRKADDGISHVSGYFKEDRYILAGINDKTWDRSSFCQVLIDECLVKRISALAVETDTH